MVHDVLIDIDVHLESFINDENENNFGINIFRILLLIFIRVKFECRAIVEEYLKIAMWTLYNFKHNCSKQ